MKPDTILKGLALAAALQGRKSRIDQALEDAGA